MTGKKANAVVTASISHGKVENLPYVMYAIAELELEAMDRTKEQLKNVDGLAANMAQIGQISPIVITRRDGGKAKVIAGKRRVMAAKKLGWKELKATVLDVDDKNLPISVVSDNLFNAPPEPLLQAHIFNNLLAAKVFRSQNELAKASGIEQSLISRRIKLLEADQEIQDSITSGEISQSTIATKPKQEVKKITKKELQQEQTEGKMFKLPPEILLPADGATEKSPYDIRVGKHDITFKVTLRLEDIKANGLTGTLCKEIKRVGDDEVSAAIIKFAKETF